MLRQNTSWEDALLASFDEALRRAGQKDPQVHAFWSGVRGRSRRRFAKVAVDLLEIPLDDLLGFLAARVGDSEVERGAAVAALLAPLLELVALQPAVSAPVESLRHALESWIPAGAPPAPPGSEPPLPDDGPAVISAGGLELPLLDGPSGPFVGDEDGPCSALGCFLNSAARGNLSAVIARIEAREAIRWGILGARPAGADDEPDLERGRRWWRERTGGRLGRDAWIVWAVGVEPAMFLPRAVLIELLGQLRDRRSAGR